MKKLVYVLSLVFLFSSATLSAQNYQTHKVKKGETIEQIAKQYKVLATAIYALNPDSRKKLKPNSVLIIPKYKTVVKVPTEIADNTKKELDGFKKHKVRRKETLYGISKKYNVTEAEIKKHNTFLYANNLRKGDRLQIPIYKIVEVKSEPKPITNTYVVKPKEGKWRIAYKYGITVQELDALNPSIGATLNEGQLINVPNLENADIKKIDDKYSYYNVLPTEGFYRLKVKLGLEQEELERLNPGLAETGLKEGMVLKIPYNKALVVEPEPVGSPILNSGTSEPISFGKVMNTADLSSQPLDTRTKNIAIMLPFELNKVNIDSVSDTKDRLKKNNYLSKSLDFYSGILTGLKKLEDLGLNLKVDVYDTENRASKVNSILMNSNFENTDAVIGPLRAKHFNVVASNLSENNIPVVSPITKTVTVSSNVFQTRPKESLLKQKVVSHFKVDKEAHIVIISDSDNITSRDELKRDFPNATLLSSRKNKKSGKEAYYVFEQDIAKVLKPGKNVVFLETRNAGFISNVTSLLNSKISTTTSVILTTTHKNKAFEGGEVSNYHLSNLQFTFPSISKMVNEEDNIEFVSAYKEEYGETPNTYAVRGYDVIMDVVLRMVTSENLYASVNNTPITRHAENMFGYKKKTFGGYTNESVYLVQYKDLKIVEVK